MLPASRNKDALELRSSILYAIREFFIAQHYLEVETPYLLSTVIPEAHIDPIEVEGRYLHTSPEQCMKMLLAQGFPKIFQICRCFRKGERGGKHLPEFTMLEWYKVDADYKEIMEECEQMVKFVAEKVGLEGEISYGELKVSLSGHWDRITVMEAFERYSEATVEQALEQGKFDELMVSQIEPSLGIKRPCFVYDYPASMSALARLRGEDARFCERFELYIAGLELANGFSELNDPVEQRERFLKELSARRRAGKSTPSMPERFLESLRDMPDAAGVALGVDRLVMLMAGALEIDQVVSFSPEEV